MLPRRRPPPRHHALGAGTLPDWLKAPGSLTARLREHGVVSVQVLVQGHRTLWRQEQRALRTVTGHVREVLLRVDDRPAVWARSTTPLNAVRAGWRAIKGLGTRPLAELLFTTRRVRRGPLHTWHPPRRSPEAAHLARSWRTHAGLAPPPQWARHSVFLHRGQPLQVLEAFAPWVGDLATSRGRPGRSRPRDVRNRT